MNNIPTFNDVNHVSDDYLHLPVTRDRHLGCLHVVDRNCSLGLPHTIRRIIIPL